MKRMYALLGLALLAGCGEDCNKGECSKKKEKSCNKGCSSEAEASTVKEAAVAQETPSAENEVTPSK